MRKRALGAKKGLKSPPNGHCPSMLAQDHQYGTGGAEDEEEGGRLQHIYVIAQSSSGAGDGGAPPFFYVLS